MKSVVEERHRKKLVRSKGRDPTLVVNHSDIVKYMWGKFRENPKP